MCLDFEDTSALLHFLPPPLLRPRKVAEETTGGERKRKEPAPVSVLTFDSWPWRCRGCGGAFRKRAGRRRHLRKCRGGAAGKCRRPGSGGGFIVQSGAGDG